MKRVKSGKVISFCICLPEIVVSLNIPSHEKATKTTQQEENSFNSHILVDDHNIVFPPQYMLVYLLCSQHVKRKLQQKRLGEKNNLRVRLMPV